MPDRDTLKLDFLARAGWAEAAITPLAGDASMRRYDRLRRDADTAVLMDAPPEKGEDVRPFLTMARYLTAQKLSAPQVLAEDVTHGFLLLEDLGDNLYSRAIRRMPDSETPLYAAAADALVALQRAPLPAGGLRPYDAPMMTRLAGLAYEWYAAPATGRPAYGQAGFSAVFQPRLTRATGLPRVVILRDFHAENLLWIPQRSGVARVGLLDFQDAQLGHPAYDLVSLLQDARRDVPKPLEEQMIARFAAASKIDQATFRAAYDMLGVQRNLRILGVFARLCLARGKPHYIDLIPRVWGYLRRNLDRPGLEDLRARLLSDLPEPTPETLDILRQQCATRQMP